MLALDAVLALTTLCAVAVLLLRYGFGVSSPVPLWLLNVAGGVVVCFFVLDRILRAALAGRKWKQVLRHSWVDWVLIVLAGVALAVSFRTHANVSGLGAAYIVVTHVYLLFALLLRASGINQRMAESGLGPAKIFLLSFAILCLAGSGLLALPASGSGPGNCPGYLDALFTSVSATCVTGLITVDTGSDWSFFGQAVILVLIQLGGLGIMIFGAVLTMMMGKRLGLRGSRTMGKMMATSTGDVARVMRFVVVVTLVLEAIGALGLYPMYASIRAGGTRVFSSAQAFWYSLFHSVSAFCNAGFSLHDANLTAGLSEGWDASLRSHWQLMGVFAPLIILGGLGFPVLEDLWQYGRSVAKRLRKGKERIVVGEESRPRPRLTLQTKIVLTSSALLIVLGACGIWLLSLSRHGPLQSVGAEDWKAMRPWGRLYHSVFLSVSTRTAGFNTFDLSQLPRASKLLICLLMSIGGSPAGTAGGVKTVTVALLVMTVVATLRRRDEVEIFRRSISSELLRKTMVVAVLYLLLVMTITVGLAAAMAEGFDFIDLLFEACSACGTVGLSAGVTPHLSVGGKIVIVAAMFIGRLGPITLLLALTGRAQHVKYSYPPEDLTIG
jgi:trk system potassium uptake protein TrkH